MPFLDVVRRAVFLPLLCATALVCAVQAPEIGLPLKAGSVRFAVIGDSGTGGPAQYGTAARMAEARRQFPFDFVIMLGDNIYGGTSPADFKRKFEDPYRPLLDDDVKFYAALGNHDQTNERLYKPFNMDGKRFYSFKRGNAEFFALDSNYMDPQQLDWLNRQLDGSHSAWKICYLHHPLYSHGRAHGPDLDLRRVLEPLLRQHGVNVVFAGHEHSYERLQPQHGIYYFVLGNSGQLRFHDLKLSAETARGFDSDRTFALVEIDQDQLHFQVVSRAGQTVDSGVIRRAPNGGE
jgi:hypothetical protein